MALMYKGTGVIAPTDYKKVEWVGKTKGGKAVKITLAKAINLGNIDWSFADKDDTVAELVFTAVYDNTNGQPETTDEPFIIELEDGLTAGASEIVLGVGKLTIGSVVVGLSRGGGKFSVEREFRTIPADGDRGPVEGRIELVGSKATLTINTLQFLVNIADVYPAMATVAAVKAGV